MNPVRFCEAKGEKVLSKWFPWFYFGMILIIFCTYIHMAIVHWAPTIGKQGVGQSIFSNDLTKVVSHIPRCLVLGQKIQCAKWHSPECWMNFFGITEQNICSGRKIPLGYGLWPGSGMITGNVHPTSGVWFAPQIASFYVSWHHCSNWLLYFLSYGY